MALWLYGLEGVTVSACTVFWVFAQETLPLSLQHYSSERALEGHFPQKIQS